MLGLVSHHNMKKQKAKMLVYQKKKKAKMLVSYRKHEMEPSWLQWVLNNPNKTLKLGLFIFIKKKKKIRLFYLINNSMFPSAPGHGKRKEGEQIMAGDIAWVL